MLPRLADRRNAKGVGRLVVDVNQLELLVEGEFKPIVEFDFVGGVIAFHLQDAGPRVVHFDVFSDLCGNQFGGNGRVFAVEVCPFTRAVEFEFVAVCKEDFVGGLEEVFFHFCEGHIHIGEVFFDKLLRCGGQLIDGDGSVVVSANDGLQCEEANEQYKNLFHGSMFFRFDNRI